MGGRAVSLPEVGWVAGPHPLERKKPVGPGAVLLRFEPGFVDPRWCANGHAGFVVEGRLAFDLTDGTAVVAGAGEAFTIEPGTRHRARVDGEAAVVAFVTVVR